MIDQALQAAPVGPGGVRGEQLGVGAGRRDARGGEPVDGGGEVGDERAAHPCCSASASSVRIRTRLSTTASRSPSSTASRL